MKKSIAIFSSLLVQNGATKSLIELLKKIDYDKLNVDLYVLSFDYIDEFYLNQIPKEVKLKQVPRYRLNLYSLKNILKYPFHFFKAITSKIHSNSCEKVIEFKKTAARYPKLDIKYDVAISYRHFDIDVFYVANNMIATKKAFWVHGVQELNNIDTRVLSKTYKKYNKIFPVSYTAKANLSKYFTFTSKLSEVIYSIVDDEEIVNLSKSANKLPYFDDIVKVLTISRLSEEKGLDLAIESSKVLKESNINFKWYICGDGPLKNYLLKKIEEYGLNECFILLGNVDNPYGYLSNCDIYVQTSYLESYCLAINEAKIFNKPIVSTNIPAANEQIINYKSGLLCELNKNSIADKIIELISNKELQNTLISNLKSNKYFHLEATNQLYNFVID